MGEGGKGGEKRKAALDAAEREHMCGLMDVEQPVIESSSEPSAELV